MKKTILRIISLCLVILSLFSLYSCTLVSYKEVELQTTNYHYYISVNTYVEEVGEKSAIISPYKYVLHVTTDKKHDVTFKNVTIVWNFPEPTDTPPEAELSYDGKSHVSMQNECSSIKTKVRVKSITGTVIVPTELYDEIYENMTDYERIKERIRE